MREIITKSSTIIARRLPILRVCAKIVGMNWGIIGHEWAVQLLSEQIAQKRLRHAYLITGPRGVGRCTLALRLTQALNCLAPPEPGQPCRACRACLQIERMQYPDLLVVQAEQEGWTLKVDQVREMQRSLSLHPYEGRYRVALLLRFEEAHPSAMNALLKTLEEPASQVVLLLTAESAERLLPTIISRCETLRLRPLPLEQVSRGLQEEWGAPEDQARLLAHLSGGRPGLALQLHLEPERLQQRQAWLADLLRLLTFSRKERFDYIEPLTKERSVLRSALNVWLSFWRDILIKTCGAVAPITNLDYQQEIEQLAARLNRSAALGVVSAVENALSLVDQNVNPRLVGEVLTLDLPKI